MSRTLARIRETVGDPIFVQAGRKMVPTPRALELRGAVREAVERASQLLARPRKSISARSTSSSTCARTTSSSACTAAACSRRWRAGCRARCCASCPRKTTSTTTRCAAAASTCSSARRAASAGDSRPAAVHDDLRRPRARRSPDLRRRHHAERFARWPHIGVSRRGKSAGRSTTRSRARPRAAGAARRADAVCGDLRAAGIGPDPAAARASRARRGAAEPACARSSCRCRSKPC